MELEVQAQPISPNRPADVSKTAIDTYLELMLAIGNAAADLCPHIGVNFQNNILRLRQRTAFDLSAASVVESLDALKVDLNRFVERTNEYYRLKTGDIASMLGTVAEAIDTFETRDHFYLERLTLVIRQMETAMAPGAGQAELAAAYNLQLGHLRTFVEKLSADSRSVFSKLQDEISAIEERLVRAEAVASIDPLTALVNRREMERLIREQLENGKPLSLLLFDIKRLKSLNERFGQDAGDQLLRQFGARLAAQVRPRDIVSRWGGDEFAVVFDCSASAAMSRAQQIAGWVSGRYPVNIEGQDWKPEIEAEVVVIEYNRQESPDTFFRRVDRLVPRCRDEARPPTS